jgi:rubrerythrin
MNVVDFAIQAELDNKAYYEKLEAEASVEGLKKIFSILAAEELKHFHVMNALKAGEATELADSAILERAQNIFQTLQVDEDVRTELRTKLDGYRHAMKIEAESIRFYEDVARRETKSEVIVLLLKIVEEEKRHYAIIENIYNFIDGHEKFMVWHKFGKNREDLG